MEHIVFLLNIPEQCGWGGCEEQLMDYFSRIDFESCKATLVVTKDIFAERLPQLGLPVEVKIFPFVPKAGGAFRRFGRMFSMLREMRAQRVVFVHNGFLQFLLPSFFAAYLTTKGPRIFDGITGRATDRKGPSRKYFGFIPGISLWWYAQVVPLALRGWLSKRILAVSEGVKERMVHCYLYPSKRVAVTYHGIDPKVFFPDQQSGSQLRGQLGIPPEAKVIISSSRLSQQKALERLITAFNEAGQNNLSLWLVFVGEGAEWEALEELIADSPCQERIMLLGYRSNVADFLKMADIFVLPSRYEGLGISLLEAMATQLVCVSTITTGPQEIISNGENGILVSNDQNGVTKGLHQALALSPEESVLLCQRARQTVLDRFDKDKIVKKALSKLDLKARQ